MTPTPPRFVPSVHPRTRLEGFNRLSQPSQDPLGAGSGAGVRGPGCATMATASTPLRDARRRRNVLGITLGGGGRMTQVSGTGEPPERAVGYARELRVGSGTGDLAAIPDTVSPWRNRLRSATDELLRARSPESALDRGWFLPVLLVWAGGRAVNVLFLAGAFAVSRLTGGAFGTDGVPARTFLDFLSGWDAHWYGTIAASGYPATLPLDLYGNVKLNNWAFLPVFPFMERLLADVFGIPWQLGGILISLA